MMQRQQKGRVGAGRLARKLGPALWITAAMAAALIAGSCGGRPAAPGAPAAGMVVAAANHVGAAWRSDVPLAREYLEIKGTREASNTAMPEAFVVTPIEEPAAAPARATAAPSATPLPAATDIVAASATPAPLTAAPPPAPQFTVLENANVRAGPGTAYSIVGGLAAGQSYGVDARNADGSWLEFKYRGAAGWVSAAGLVSGTGDLASLPVAGNIPPPPPSPTRAPLTPAPVPGPNDPVLADLVARINRARADAGLNQLRWTPELAQTAGAHTWDMAIHHFFSHSGSDGSDVTVRLRRAGYAPLWWGEILTHVNGGGGPDAAFSQLWNSPHHHDIIVGDRFTDVGAAWIKDPADGSFNYYAVVFGRR